MNFFKDKKLLAGLAFFLIGVAMFFFVDLTLWNNIKFTREKIERSEQELALLQDLVAVISELNTTFGDVAEAADKVEVALPPRAGIPEILVQVSVLASQNGLALQGINFSSEESSRKQTYSPVTINLQVSGDYEALKTFVVALEQNLRIIDVQRISFAAGSEDEGPINFNLSLTTYFQ
jgi:Tfp pilus assembly protein PilO